MILKGVASVLSPGGRRGRLSILIFHRVLAQRDPLFPGEPDIQGFDRLLSWVGKWFRVVALDEAVAGLRAGTLPARALAITFDDGYADNALNALPVLQRHGMVATFFVASAFLDGGRMWNDSIIEAVRACPLPTLDLADLGLGCHRLGSVEERRIAIDSLLGKVKYFELARRSEVVDGIISRAGVPLPQDLMMTSDQVRLLRRAGMQIGAHTCSHPILARLPDAAAVEEIRASKAVLEGLLAEEVSLFAYPNGKPGRDYLGSHAAMVRDAGFSAAVSTAPGVAVAGGDPFQMPRFTPWERSRFRFGLRLAANLTATRPEVC